MRRRGISGEWHQPENGQEEMNYSEVLNCLQELKPYYNILYEYEYEREVSKCSVKRSTTCSSAMRELTVHVHSYYV